MKKTYYEIELRIGKKEQRFIPPEIENYYYSNGYIIFSENTFEGFLTDDYIKGIYEKKQMSITIFEKLYTKTFTTEFKENITISNNSCYLLFPRENDDEFAGIYFIHKIDDVSKQEKIEDELKKVKATRLMP